MIEEHHITVSRTARYFTLGEITPNLKQVWFVCHGYGQLASFFIRHFECLDNSEILVVAPEGLSRFYLENTPDRRVGATWMTREDRLNEIDDYVNYLDELAENIFLNAERPGKRVFVLVFSQATATVCRWIARGKIKPDDLILWAGNIPPELDLAKIRLVFDSLKLTIVVGNTDRFAKPELVAGEQSRLEENGIPYQFISFDGGHQLNEDVLKQLAELDA